jgi:hypothetical protein
MISNIFMRLILPMMFRQHLCDGIDTLYSYLLQIPKCLMILSGCRVQCLVHVLNEFDVGY